MQHQGRGMANHDELYTPNRFWIDLQLNPLVSIARWVGEESWRSFSDSGTSYVFHYLPAGIPDHAWPSPSKSTPAWLIHTAAQTGDFGRYLG